MLRKSRRRPIHCTGENIFCLNSGPSNVFFFITHACTPTYSPPRMRTHTVFPSLLTVRGEEFLKTEKSEYSQNENISNIECVLQHHTVISCSHSLSEARHNIDSHQPINSDFPSMSSSVQLQTCGWQVGFMLWFGIERY